MIKLINLNEAVQILSEIKSASFLQIMQVTDARLKKTGNPYKDCLKVTKMNVLVNSEYQTRVENRLIKEHKNLTDYHKGKNTMPLEFTDNKVIGFFHGNPVLQYTTHDNSNPKVKYMFNGKIIDKNKIKDFIPLKTPATNQGTNKEIIIRKVYLKNLHKFKINKQVYKIIH